MWHKENLINMAVRELFPLDWECFAWIDADIEFEDPHWVHETLNKLYRHFDVIQLFSHALELDTSENTMQVSSSFCYRFGQ